MNREFVRAVLSGQPVSFEQLCELESSSPVAKKPLLSGGGRKSPSGSWGGVKMRIEMDGYGQEKNAETTNVCTRRT